MTNNNKPSREEMINAIYEKIARKDLSFGCKCWIHEPDAGCNTMINIGTIKKETLFSKKYLEAFWSETDKKIIYENYKIIGHPVMIGDVMDFIMKNENIDDEEKHGANHFFFYYWQEKRKPIEEQNGDCIEFVYNLIK